MGGNGKKTQKDKAKDGDKKPPPKSVDDDEDFEDGDFATPKRDRNGDDDQPL